MVPHLDSEREIDRKRERKRQREMTVMNIVSPREKGLP
jgi:hypothetical protein